MPEPALKLLGLGKTYRGTPRPALREVDLAVEPGEVLGVLGPNGAGKTTLLSIAATLLAPTQGTIRIFGRDPQKEAPAIRELVGLVPQEVGLYPGLTAAENLSYFAAMHRLRGEAARARVRECLEVVGLDPGEPKRASRLSGGMRRRANLAVGILQRPSLLLLDEPTVGIDPHSREVILDWIVHRRGEGTTVLYCTHSMEEAERVSTRVAILDDGRVAALGSPAALIAAHPGCRDLGDLFFRLVGRELRD